MIVAEMVMAALRAAGARCLFGVPGGGSSLDLMAAARAEGIIFAAPSFCDPALLDQPMLRAGADEAHIPSISFRYAENTGQFQQFREQAGTFADSLKLWGDA